MRTKLNEEMEEFFINNELEDITIQTIENHFDDIHKKNEYGGLLHAAIHNEYPEDKVLKFMEVLLANGVDPNLKGEMTGYSFIHLALYGYTKSNEDYSYSTEFIVKLINISKNYNFDVGIRDADSDSIIHTALASEVYTGSVIALIGALGDDFDLLCRDACNNDIYQALLNYKEEARMRGLGVWFDRLEKEEEEIKRIVEIGSYNLDEVENELTVLKGKLLRIVEEMSAEYLLKNYQNILKLRDEMNFYINKKELITQNKEQDFSKVWISCCTLIIKVLKSYVEELALAPSYQKIAEVEKIIEVLQLSDLNDLLLEIKTKYDEKVMVFEKNISSAETLEAIEKLETEVACITDEILVRNLGGLLKEKTNNFRSKLEKIEKQLKIVLLMEPWLDNVAVPWCNYDDSSYEDKLLFIQESYSNKTIEELENLDQELAEIINSNKELMKKVVEIRIVELLDFVNELDNNDVIRKDESLGIIYDHINQFKKNRKIKRRR